MANQPATKHLPSSRKEEAMLRHEHGQWLDGGEADGDALMSNSDYRGYHLADAENLLIKRVMRQSY